jgi:O-6-methylguanine DNA methyltransferase
MNVAATMPPCPNGERTSPASFEDMSLIPRFPSTSGRPRFNAESGVLQRIPRGETRSYSAVAKKIGMPKATQAVARACATNPVAAVAIPCHRVIREDGELGGYRWGIERKKQLLAMEKEAGA